MACRAVSSPNSLPNVEAANAETALAARLFGPSQGSEFAALVWQGGFYVSGLLGVAWAAGWLWYAADR